MPTHDAAAAVSAADLVAIVTDAVHGPPTSGNGIGIELELFPVTRERPSRRLRLHERVGASPPTGEVVTAAWSEAAVEGSTLSVEPGGQVEIATSCRQRVPDAIDELARTVGRVAARFDAAGAVLLAAGLDVWHGLASAPQQLATPRYERMHAHLSARGIDGPLMMRHTCALQVNLDLGAGSVAESRWRAANLLAPLATATFAASPGRVAGRPVRSRRSLAWQALDPSRTGFAPGVVAGRGGVVDHVLEHALGADVLLLAPPTGRSPRDHGWRLRDWLEHGHELGWPTERDVREHLTTLFPEVRARGFLELRAIDAVPAAFRRALVLLVAGAVLDDRARDAILALLEPHRRDLPTLARRCATDGLSDPRLCALAVEVWAYARDGAARLPGVTRADVTVIEAYVDRFTVRGRAPADELAELLAVDPVGAAAWASEPLPTTAEVCG